LILHRPLIAVVGRHSGRAEGVRGPAVAIGGRYLDALERAGATPVVVPPSAGAIDDELVARFDGVVLAGGGDVSPVRYGAVPGPLLEGVDDRRDAAELAVLRAVLSDPMPVLAICRGLQVLDVALGGTLVQDLPSSGCTELHDESLHEVRLEPGSRVAAAMGTCLPSGHSLHHQAIDRLGDGLRVTGRSAGGVIEAVELDGPTWVVAVQWHPEDTAATDPHQQGLFDAFVRAARG
jgi:putative glutamine amidotransferase